MKKSDYVFLILLFGIIFILGCQPGEVNNTFSDVKNSLGLELFSGKATSCNSDGDCEVGYICEGNSCKLGCLEDSECPSGSCDLETGRCKEKGECSSDSQCSPGRCDLSTQKCVECLYQYDCRDDDSVCNLETNKCEKSKTEEVEKPAEEKKNNCVDSDGGDEPYISGKLAGNDINGNVIDQNDQCNNDGKRLFEKVCTETSYTYNEHACENGCKDGACVKGSETPEMTFYEDKDQDGYGNPDVEQSASVLPEGYVKDNTDCNDTNENVNPDATESCDKADNNCDGEVDEGDVCKGELSCNDPDGDDITKASSLSYKDKEGNEQSFEDKCIGLVGVLEGLCSEDGEFSCLDADGNINDECRKRCPKGQICSNGACQESTAQCIDPDGKDQNKAGTVSYSGVSGGTQSTLSDSCIGIRFVKEAYCNFANQGRFEILKCGSDEVCVSGACVKSPASCTDTDGNDRTTKGTVKYTYYTGISSQFTDICSGTAYVYEGMCKSDTFIARGAPCPQGTACKDGACVQGQSTTEYSCQDSDGFNLYMKGSVNYVDETGKNTKTDSCDGNTLVENYCYSNRAREYRRLCYGGSCADGKCVIARG